VDTPRCTSCRNPIKARHARTVHPRTGHVFHDDCWGTAHEAIQEDYLRRITDEGVDAWLSPYVCVYPTNTPVESDTAEALIPEQREYDAAAVLEDEPVLVVPAQAVPVAEAVAV